MNVRLTSDLSLVSDPIRYRMLSSLVRAAIASRVELSDGYAVAVRGAKMSLTKLAEWIELEQQCCPFLSFELFVPSGQSGMWWLTLTGPEGAKTVLEGDLLVSQPSNSLLKR